MGKVTEAKRLSVAAIEHTVAMLRLIARDGCRSFTTGSCATNGRVLGAYYGSEAWCDACIAADALRRLQEKK